MSTRRFLFGALTIALLSAPAFAQDSKPSPTPAPKLTAPMTAPKASTTGAATAGVTAKTNLNNASEMDIGKLPKITPAQSKAIVEHVRNPSSRTGTISSGATSFPPTPPLRSKRPSASDRLPARSRT